MHAFRSLALAIMAASSLMFLSIAGFAAKATAAQEASPVVANADWQPVIEEFDGVPMAYVPPGCILLGSDAGAPNEQPVTEVCFQNGYWIDVYEVTHDQFAAFGAVAGRPAAFDVIGGDLPRERVTWFEARDLCSLRGGRLPTEAEWEFAARGPDGLTYPWGDTFTPDTAVVSLGPGNHPEPVGSRPSGASWVGAEDMSGNIYEWTDSLFAPYPYNANDGREEPGKADTPRVIRGSAWSYSAELARASARGFRPPTTETPDIGFRCARDS